MITDNVRQVTQRLESLSSELGRERVNLVAVSKRQPASAIAAAHAAGLIDFGENYLQEAIPKIQALDHLPLCWHFIGPVQSNKTQLVADHFDWVHTVDRLKIAQRLSRQRRRYKPNTQEIQPLNLCIQVNIDGDQNKSGVTPDNALALLQELQALPNLQPRGLMTILDQQTEPAIGFAKLANLFGDLATQASGSWDTLSMGMSADYPAAVAAGATHVRIGTAIFGERS